MVSLPATHSSESQQLSKVIDRRKVELSESADTSSHGASFEAALLENLALERQLMEDSAQYHSPQDPLRRLLSIRSVVSTIFLFVERQQAPIGTNTKFREIGTSSLRKGFEHVEMR